MSFDIYATITERVITALEKGTIPWKKPWSRASGCVSYATGKPYSLLNHILLDGIAGEYLTFNQCQQAGGRIKKGEKSKMVVFWKMLPVENKETNEKEIIPFLRYYNVFHTSQCEGIDPKWMVEEPIEDNHLLSDEKAEEIISDYVTNSGVKLKVVETDEAFYNSSTDEVIVPKLSQYRKVEEYYSTLFHELVHSTGHKDRLNRLMNTASFGGRDYSKEELIAELGSTFIINYLGLESNDSFSNSAAYINGWLRALRKDKRLLVNASGAAEKAVSMIVHNQNAEVAL